MFRPCAPRCPKSIRANLVLSEQKSASRKNPTNSETLVTEEVTTMQSSERPRSAGFQAPDPVGAQEVGAGEAVGSGSMGVAARASSDPRVENYA